jgi:hypothetical protein
MALLALYCNYFDWGYESCPRAKVVLYISGINDSMMTMIATPSGQNLMVAATTYTLSARTA